MEICFCLWRYITSVLKVCIWTTVLLSVLLWQPTSHTCPSGFFFLCCWTQMWLFHLNPCNHNIRDSTDNTHFIKNTELDMLLSNNIYLKAKLMCSFFFVLDNKKNKTLSWKAPRQKITQRNRNNVKPLFWRENIMVYTVHFWLIVFMNFLGTPIGTYT